MGQLFETFAHLPEKQETKSPPDWAPEEWVGQSSGRSHFEFDLPPFPPLPPFPREEDRGRGIHLGFWNEEDWDEDHELEAQDGFPEWNGRDCRDDWTFFSSSDVSSRVLSSSGLVGSVPAARPAINRRRDSCTSCHADLTNAADATIAAGFPESTALVVKCKANSNLFWTECHSRSTRCIRGGGVSGTPEYLTTSEEFARSAERDDYLIICIYSLNYKTSVSYPNFITFIYYQNVLLTSSLYSKTHNKCYL